LGEHVFAMKEQAAARARAHRRDQGWSIKQIAAALDVAVSSVSVWVRDVELTPKQTAALHARIGAGRVLGNARTTARARAVRKSHQAYGRAMARRADPLHVMGCMLYWAEGSRSRNAVSIANADPALLALFICFLRHSFRCRDEEPTFRCNCFLNTGLSLAEIQSWWLTRLQLPPECLRRAIVNRPSSAGGARKRTLPYGTGHLRVHSTKISQSIHGAIQEYAGIDRPEWLDLR
jgi:hypothetical protein